MAGTRDLSSHSHNITYSLGPTTQSIDVCWMMSKTKELMALGSRSSPCVRSKPYVLSKMSLSESLMLDEYKTCSSSLHNSPAYFTTKPS